MTRSRMYALHVDVTAIETASVTVVDLPLTITALPAHEKLRPHRVEHDAAIIGADPLLAYLGLNVLLQIEAGPLTIKL